MFEKLKSREGKLIVVLAFIMIIVTYAKTIAFLQMLIFLWIAIAQSSEVLVQSIEPITVLAGEKNPIQIKKTIGTFDGINNTLPIMIELKYLGRYSVDIGYIEDLGDTAIINCSGYKLIKKLENIYNDSKIIQHPIDIKPSSVQFYIHNLHPKERVRFSYVVNTTRRNDFLINTTIRFYSEDGYPDVDYIFKVSTMPVFDVVILAKELEAQINKPVYLRYEIQYLGPANAEIFNASIDSSSSFYSSYNQSQQMKIRKGETILIDTYLKYKYEGVYILPAININEAHFNFNKTVTIINDSPDVSKVYYALLPYWAGLISIMTLMPGMLALITFWKNRQPIRKQRIKKGWLK